MCIIVAKPKDVPFPDWNVLLKCFQSNYDGAGFAIARGNHVEIDKGYFKFDQFHEELMKKARQADSVLMHFRISTSGRVDAGCCHPYPVCSDYKQMKVTDQLVDMAIAHNGVLSCNPEFPWVNDTMTFVKSICQSPEHLTKLLEDPSMYDLFEMAISGSKLAVITPDGSIELHGSGWTKDKGVYYSNSTYKYSRYVGYGSYAGGWGSYETWDQDDDDNDDKLDTKTIIPLTDAKSETPKFTLCEACGEWGYEIEDDICHYCGRTGPEIDDVVRAVIGSSTLPKLEDHEDANE